MFKLKLALAALALTFVAANASAQTNEPQPAEPSTPNATDALIGVWAPTYYACISQYGTHRPYYPFHIEIMHARTEFIARTQVLNESCRLEGNYSLEEKSVNYQVKTQECATPKLAEELKANLDEGYMIINLSSEIADKICPAPNSTLRLYLVRR